MSEHPFIDYAPRRLGGEEMVQRAEQFFCLLSARRSVREFSSESVPRELIEIAIMTASTSPSGANQQPWRFVAVSDPSVKRQIRVAAEAEERLSYEGGRMPPAWRRAIAHMQTDWRKPYLEIAPWLVVVFEQRYGVDAQGKRFRHYYVKESVGMACGLFIAALHNMGLATLSHTPSPMRFLSEILDRPVNERPYVLFPVGYPACGARVPDQRRKTLPEVAVWVEEEAPRPGTD